MSEPLLSFVRRGRPPRAGVRATKRIEFVVTDQERRALEKMAKDNRQTMADAVREAVNSFVGDYGERVVFVPSGDRFKRR